MTTSGSTDGAGAAMYLAEFLRERLAEDEAAARAATPGPWQPESPLLSDVVSSALLGRVADCSVGNGYRAQSLPDADHIARHDPARVLREVASTRRTVEWCMQVIGDRDLAGYGRFGSLRDDPQALAVILAVETLRLLALPYADHPGYQSDWAPSA